MEKGNERRTTALVVIDRNPNLMNIIRSLLTRLPRMLHLFYSFLIIIPLLGVFYCLCLKLGSMDLFQSLLSKIGFSLGSRVLLSRGLGCEGWPLLVLIFSAFGIFDGTIMNMMGGNETGPHRGDAGPSSTQNSESDSGSWRKYLNSPEDKEGNSGPESSTSHNPGHPPQEGEAPNLPIGVMGPAAPSIEFLLKKIPSVLRGCQRVAVRRDVCTTIFENLHLLDASPQKRLKIMEALREIESNREIFLNNPNLKAAYHLMVSVNDWEREQRNFPNPVDDVP